MEERDDGIAAAGAGPFLRQSIITGHLQFMRLGREREREVVIFNASLYQNARLFFHPQKRLQMLKV